MKADGGRWLWLFLAVDDGGGAMVVVLWAVVVTDCREREIKAERERERVVVCVYLCVRREEKGFCRIKTNPLLLADCRHLVHLFSCRCGPQTADLFLQKKQTTPY
ncbi:hypothetical protein Hanom_Chr06g00487751 [Helianthus anomalus]